MEADSKSQMDSITKTCMDEIAALETKVAQLEIENQSNSASKDKQSEALKAATKAHAQEKNTLLD